MKVGFIGLGEMGRRMAVRLVNNGYEVYGVDHLWNADSKIRSVATPAELGEIVDVTCLMVPAPQDVNEVLFGKGGLAVTAKSGHYVIQSSTINLKTTKKIAKQLADRGIRFIDAPVGGSTSAAENGELVVLGGGEEEDFTALAPILNSWAKEVQVFGPAGAGTAVKLVLNAITISTIAAAAEVVNWLAQNEPEIDLTQVAANLAAVGPSLAKRVPILAADAEVGGFSLKHAAKDMQLIAEDILTAEVLKSVAKLSAEAVSAGYGDHELAGLGAYVRTKKQ